MQAQICSWLEEDSDDELDADLENGEQYRVDTIESDSSAIRSPHETDTEQSSDENDADISSPTTQQQSQKNHVLRASNYFAPNM